MPVENYHGSKRSNFGWLSTVTLMAVTFLSVSIVPTVQGFAQFGGRWTNLRHRISVVDTRKRNIISRDEMMLFSSPSESPMQDRKVAVVTGASRGIGRGIALELGAEGYVVYCLGRSSRTNSDMSRKVAAGLDVTVDSAAEEVTTRGGQGRAIVCDLTQDGVIEAALAQVNEEQGRLDILVCSAYETYQDENLRGNFWEQSMQVWDSINNLGLRQVYASCRAAAPYMIETGKTHKTLPLMCLVSSFGGKSYSFNVAYSIGKGAIDRMALDMSYQLKKYGVATIALYPGLVRTEANLQMEKDGIWDEVSGGLDLSQGETPTFSGRALIALTKLPQDQLMERSGQVAVVAELAKELGFTDIGGNQPPSIRSLKYLLPNFVFPQIERESGKELPDWIKDSVPDILLPWSVFSSPPPDLKKP